MNDFKFNRTQVTPQTVLAVEGSDLAPRTARPQSDAQRIADARARAMQRSKDNNKPGAMYGFEYPDSHYTDYAGPETSNWDAGVLVCIAEILEAPILGRSRFVWSTDHYDVRTGQFNLTDTAPVAIEELKAAIDGRIAELGLSKVRIWEWFADVREPLGQEWWRSDLRTRIQKFKFAKSSACSGNQKAP